jgi:hypothetical protein
MTNDADWVEHAYDKLIAHLEEMLPTLLLDSHRRVLDEAGKMMVYQVDDVRARHRYVLETTDPANPDADEVLRRIHELDVELELCLQHGLDRLRELGHRFGAGEA